MLKNYKINIYCYILYLNTFYYKTKIKIFSIYIYILKIDF